MRRKALWIAGVTAVVTALVLLLLPLAAAWMLEDMLRERGASEVTIGDIDLNPFTGTAAAFDVVAKNEHGRLHVELLELDAALLSLVSGRLEVADLRLIGAHLDVIQTDDRAWQFGSIRIPAKAPTDAPAWGFGAQRVRVQDVTLTLRAAELTREFEIEDLLVERAHSWRPGEPLSVKLALRSGAAELALQARATPFAQAPEITGELELENLLLQNIQSPSLTAAFEQPAGRLDAALAFELRLSPDGSLGLEVDGGLQLAGTGLLQRGARLEFDEFEWRGAVSGRTSADDETAPFVFQVTGDAEFGDLRVVDAASEAVLLSLGVLEVRDLQLDEQRAGVAAVTASGLDVHLQREAHGGLRLPAELAPRPRASEAAAAREPGGEMRLYGFGIERLALDGVNRLHVRDESVAPVFDADVRITELVLDGLDTGAAQPIAVKLVANVSDTDRLEVTGTLAPFAAAPGADLSVNLEGLDLSRFSAYVPGYNIERGRLSVSSRPLLVDGQLDVQNDVLIDKLKIGAKTDAEDELVAAGGSMPVDVMLDLLRDSDDRIELEIPITGTLDSLDVGLDQIIRKATQAALQKAAMSYVKTALQPLGAILLAADLAGKAARPRFEPVRFEAGKSAPADEQAAYAGKIAELLTQRPKLHLTLCGVATKQDEIALTPPPAPADAASGELTTAPDTVVDAPVAPATDAPAPAEPVSEETLLALAKARADWLKQDLLQRGVDAAQLFDCRPSYEPGEGDEPRLEVML